MATVTLGIKNKNMMEALASKEAMHNRKTHANIADIDGIMAEDERGKRQKLRKSF